MKTYAHVAGVQYPAPSAPESKVEPRQPKPLRVYVPRHITRHTIKVDGRNMSTLWLRKNGLCIRVVDGVKTVVVAEGRA